MIIVHLFPLVLFEKHARTILACNNAPFELDQLDLAASITRLRKFSLVRQTKLSDSNQGARALAESLKQNTTLTQLDLIGMSV